MKINFSGNIPVQQTAGAAGFDLIADPQPVGSVHIGPGSWALVPTGTYVEIPEGYVGYVAPRSGLALRHAVTVLNAPGIIDSDYRGEIGVILINHGRETFTAKHGERIAQLIIAPVVDDIEPVIVEREELSASERGARGFGSTNV